MSAPSFLLVYGSGGLGREVAWLAEHCIAAGASLSLAAFIDDRPGAACGMVNGLPVCSLEEARRRFAGARVVSGIGSPRAREATMRKAEEAGFAPATLVHPSAVCARDLEAGEGTMVCAGNVIAVNSRIGRHVLLNFACTLGHDADIGDFTTINPGVNVSGFVRIGRRAYIGTNAAILQGTEDEPLVIGDDAVVGAGAVVRSSVPPGVTVVGVPARPISRT